MDWGGDIVDKGWWSRLGNGENMERGLGEKGPKARKSSLGFGQGY